MDGFRFEERFDGTLWEGRSVRCADKVSHELKIRIIMN